LDTELPIYIINKPDVDKLEQMIDENHILIMRHNPTTTLIPTLTPNSLTIIFGSLMDFYLPQMQSITKLFSQLDGH
jgi:hypothetical protein